VGGLLAWVLQWWRDGLDSVGWIVTRQLHPFPSSPIGSEGCFMWSCCAVLFASGGLFEILDLSYLNDLSKKHNKLNY